METEDPMEGSSYNLDIFVRTEIKQEIIEDDENYNTMALLELATCVETNIEPIEFNSSEVMVNRKTGLMYCLHCLEEMDANLLHEHMVNAHNYRRLSYKCHVCGNMFNERKVLDIHKKECRKMPEKRIKRKTFVQFLKEADGLSGYDSVPCPICAIEVPSYYLKSHMTAEHKKPDIVLICNQCNRNFKSKLTLREHIKLVHEAMMDSEECELCGQKFSSQKYLSNHKRNVHPSGNKIHKCDVCNKIFKSRLCLHQHTKYVHPPPSASVTCPYCPNKTFKSKLNLQQHLKVTHGWRNNKQESN